MSIFRVVFGLLLLGCSLSVFFLFLALNSEFGGRTSLLEYFKPAALTIPTGLWGVQLVFLNRVSASRLATGVLGGAAIGLTAGAIAGMILRHYIMGDRHGIGMVPEMIWTLLFTGLLPAALIFATSRVANEN